MPNLAWKELTPLYKVSSFISFGNKAGSFDKMMIPEYLMMTEFDPLHVSDKITPIHCNVDIHIVMNMVQRVSSSTAFDWS